MNRHPIQARHREASVKRLKAEIANFEGKVNELQGTTSTKGRRNLTVAKRCLSTRRRALERVLARPTLIPKSKPKAANKESDHA